MGYENRLYVVDYHKNVSNWAEVIAMFNLSTTGYNNLYSLFKEAPTVPDEFTMYDTDGNTAIKKDGYGRKLTYASIDDTIKAIKEDEEEYGHYRRYTPVVAFLESIKNENYENLIVVNYGY